jgi:hypothetical protein
MLQCFPIVTSPTRTAVSAKKVSSPTCGVVPFSSLIIAIIFLFSFAKSHAIRRIAEKFSGRPFSKGRSSNARGELSKRDFASNAFRHLSGISPVRGQN